VSGGNLQYVQEIGDAVSQGILGVMSAAASAGSLIANRTSIAGADLIANSSKLLGSAMLINAIANERPRLAKTGGNASDSTMLSIVAGRVELISGIESGVFAVVSDSVASADDSAAGQQYASSICAMYDSGSASSVLNVDPGSTTFGMALLQSSASSSRRARVLQATTAANGNSTQDVDVSVLHWEGSQPYLESSSKLGDAALGNASESESIASIVPSGSANSTSASQPGSTSGNLTTKLEQTTASISGSLGAVVSANLVGSDSGLELDPTSLGVEVCILLPIAQTSTDKLVEGDSILLLDSALEPTWPAPESQF